MSRLKVVTLMCTAYNINTTGKYCSAAFTEMVTLVPHNKQHHIKVLLSFHLNPWSHFRILSIESKARTTLRSIINSTTGKSCSVAFMVTLYYFIHCRLKHWNHLVLEQHQRKVLITIVCRISSTDSTVRTTTRKYSSVDFI